MSDFFYDGQVKRYLTQFMRVMSNFSYKDAKGNLTQVPVRYGDMNRQVAQILAKNSENIVQSAPFIACYIKDIQYNRDLLSDPTYVSKVQVRERAVNSDGSEYLNTQGANYTVERIMPSPYNVTFSADIWTTNTEQKLQLWEQIVILFNPSLEIQTTDNYLDWTSLSTLELTGQQFETRTVPQGLEADISVCSMTFNAPIWITPPAKVKKLGIVTKIISNVIAVPSGTLDGYTELTVSELLAGQVARAKTVVAPGNYNLLVLNNVATLIPKKDREVEQAVDLGNVKNKGNWRSLLELYPGEFIASLSQLRLAKPNGGEVVARVSLNPTDEFSLMLNIDQDTIPSNTDINGRGTIDAIINPLTYTQRTLTASTRFLTLDDINVYDDVIDPATNQPYDRADMWKNDNGTSLVAHANDIIEWNGSAWEVIFDSQATTDETYITNSYTGIQYRWDGEQWSKSFEGLYDPDAWRLIL
jgi:hypothetical protein